VGYLDVPPKPTFTRKLFPGVVEEREKKAQVGDDDWESVKAKLVESRHVWIVTKYDGDGYWARPHDAIDSWYYGSGKVTLDLEGLVEEQLAGLKMHRSATIKEMLLQLRRRVSVPVDMFTKVNREIIHYQNGIYLIHGQKLVDRNQPLPAEYSGLSRRTLRAVPVDYVPDLKMDYPAGFLGNTGATWADLFDPATVAIVEWERTLHRLFDNHEHPGQYHRFWQWLGYCLSDITDLNKSAILEGVPDTAKTSTWMTFIKLIEPADKDLAITAHVDFAEICDPKDIEFSKYIDGKKIWYDDEMGKEPIKTYTKFKKRVSEETGKVRALYLGSYNADRVGKFTGCVNILPPVYGISESFGKRIMPFFCANPYTAEEKDEQLVHFMRTSVSLAQYIVRKAMDYLADLLENGWKNAMSAEEVVYWWLIKSDIVYYFKEKMCVKVTTNRDSDDKEDVWNAFVEFRDACGIEHSSKYAATQADFTNIISGFGHPVRDDHRPKRLKGKDGELVNKDDVHVKVYFGLKVDHDKIKELLGDETASRISAKVKTYEAPPEPEDATMKDVLSALDMLGVAGQYKRSVTVMNMYNQNFNKHFMLDDWEKAIAALVQKGKVTRIDDQIVATKYLPKPPKAEKARVEKPADDDEYMKGQIMALNAEPWNEPKIWPELCCERVDGLDMTRAKHLLKIMEIEQMLRCVDIDNEVYEFS
jgi:hypothetical protein